MIIHDRLFFIDESEIVQPDLFYHDEIVRARLSVDFESSVYMVSYSRPTSTYSDDFIYSLVKPKEYIYYF